MFSEIGVELGHKDGSSSMPHFETMTVSMPDAGSPLVSDAALSQPDLNGRKHGEDQLSGETDRTGRRAVTGKLIHERSTEHGTKSDLSRHQH